MEQLTTARWTITPASDFAVVGYNPEGADMSRPNGEIIAERFYMKASNNYGDCFVWGWYETVEALEAHFPILAPPVMFWNPTYPTYGSPAYEDYGQADAVAWEKDLDSRPF